ncbi:hypothetical protein CEXT_657411, partial [Caerostris extrusa]
ICNGAFTDEGKSLGGTSYSAFVCAPENASVQSQQIRRIPPQIVLSSGCYGEILGIFELIGLGMVWAVIAVMIADIIVLCCHDCCE